MTEQRLPEDVVQPDQRSKVWPGLGTAVKVMVEPLVKVAEQVKPQLIPEGDEVTVPSEAEEPETLRVAVVFLSERDLSSGEALDTTGSWINSELPDS